MKRLPYLTLIFLFFLALADQATRYFSKRYGFHDLGLINAFMASTVHQGRPFYVHELGVNHLAWHFTPSLFLMTPLYWIFDSQFALLAWSTAAAYLGFGIFTYLVGLSPSSKTNLALPFAAALPLTLHAWRVVFAGHFESLYLPTAALTLVFLLQDRPLNWVLPPFLLALGVREDAGFFLAIQMVGLLLLPKSWIKDRGRLKARTLLLAGLSLLYVIIVVKGVFPWLGVSSQWHAQRLWPHLGNSYGEIIANCLRDPFRLLRAIHWKGFFELNAWLLLFPFASPLLGLWMNLPGFIFYTTDSLERQELMYYTSALLLPGIYLSAVVGLDRVRSRIHGGRWQAPVAACLVLGTLFWVGRHAITSWGALTRGLSQAREIGSILRQNPGVESVASDFATFTLLPNPVPKFLLDRRAEADAILFDPGETPLLAGAQSLPEIERSLSRDPNYRRLETQAGLVGFIKATKTPGRSPPSP